MSAVLSASNKSICIESKSQPKSEITSVQQLIDLLGISDVRFGGTGIGLVAMVEVVALMIGDICQCYSSEKYETPQPITCGMKLKKGQPKSVFRPGSSVVILFFQKNRIRFDADLIENGRRMDVISRYTEGFSKPLLFLRRRPKKWDTQMA